MGSTSLAEVKANQGAVATQGDHVIDMFSLRGFELAQRIAKAYASSDAVPAVFRTHVVKKSKSGDFVVENPSAMGNCLVAIETARAVGMSITAVMQHANVIEGRLTWSAQFQIGALNASSRFTPLRFQMRNLGRMKAKYKEKLGWNKAKGGFDFKDHEVEIDNVECIAWALPKGTPEPRLSIDQMRQFAGRQMDLFKALGMPVIESAPVSMKLAVEEGWYGKSGSKWQTEMRTLMLQYRAGAFFARIHAPDIVMGMGRSSEEMVDATTIEMAPDGTIRSVTLEEVARPAGGEPLHVVERVAEQQPAQDSVDPETGEISDAAAPAQSPAANKAPAPADQQDGWTPSDEELEQIRQRELAEASAEQQPEASPAPAAAAPASRRARASSQSSME